MIDRRAHAEAGFAAVLAVVVTILATIVVSVLFQAVDGERRETTRSLKRSTELPVSDSGISRYLVALNEGLVDDQTNYQLTVDAFLNPASPLRSLVNSSIRLHEYSAANPRFTPAAGCQQPGGSPAAVAVPRPAVVRRTGQMGINDTPIGRTRFVVSEIAPDQTCVFWEIFRVDPLNLADQSVALTNRRNINVIIRGWTMGSTEPRYIRASFTQPAFSDFQVLTDDHIVFGSNVAIRGKVHSNNYDMKPTAISGPASVTCVGDDARVSASTGGISLPGASASCVDATGVKPIDLGAVEKMVPRVQTRCTTIPARFGCVNRPNGNGYRVHLGLGAGRNRIEVRDGVTGALERAFETGGRPFTLLVRSDVVYVRGADTDATMPGGNVTVLAHSDDVANIVIDPPTSEWRFGPADSATTPVIGLVAQGDVVINAMHNCTGANNYRINAAILAETGTITVPPTWKSPVLQPETPTCGKLTVHGSVATRSAPSLQLSWRGGADVRGFLQRDLSWDTSLAETVPASYPTTGAWGLASWREANHDCLAVTVLSGPCR